MIDLNHIDRVMPVSPSVKTVDEPKKIEQITKKKEENKKEHKKNNNGKPRFDGYA